MKNTLSGIILYFLMAILFSSCGSYTTLTGSVKFDASKKNETVKSSELKTYLAEKDRIKFVLREPSGFENMSEPDKIKYENFFAEVEKDLILSGHIVKDRVLLTNLIEKGGMSISEMGKMIDTDIIIEIIDVEYGIPNKVTNFKIKETGQSSNFSNWNTLDYVDCQLSKLECRITLVEVGNVGGIFKFYVSGCDKGNDFYMKVYETPGGTLDTEQEAFVGWNYGNVNYKSLTHTYDMNEQSRRKAIKRLVKTLLNELEPKE
jgi:hypothetical protein